MRGREKLKAVASSRFPFPFPQPRGKRTPSPPRSRTPSARDGRSEAGGEGLRSPHARARLCSAALGRAGNHARPRGDGAAQPAVPTGRAPSLPCPATSPLRTVREHPTAAPPRVGRSPRKALGTDKTVWLCCPDTPRHGQKAPRVDEQPERDVLNALTFPHIITHFSRKNKSFPCISTHGRSQPVQSRALETQG